MNIMPAVRSLFFICLKGAGFRGAAYTYKTGSLPGQSQCGMIRIFRRCAGTRSGIEGTGSSVAVIEYFRPSGRFNQFTESICKQITRPAPVQTECNYLYFLPVIACFFSITEKADIAADISYITEHKIQVVPAVQYPAGSNPDTINNSRYGYA